MKSIKYFLIFLIFLIGSCDADKYLDIYPENTLTEGSFYKNEGQLLMALNDVYRQLGINYDANSLVDYYGEQSSDNVYILSSAGGDGTHQYTYNFRLLPDKIGWNYNSIFICNNIIGILEKTEVVIDENLKSRMIAEAKLVRSLLYFNMVRVFGAVPLVIKKISPAEAYSYLREDPDKVYQQIIDDLIFAKSALPESYSGKDVGRVTKYAAAAILAKVYLTRGDKPAAKNELEVIINSTKFSLDANANGTIDSADYLHLFAANTKNCKESVLEVQYMSGVNTFNSQHQKAYTPFSTAFHLSGYTLTQRGEGHNTPTDDLIKEFEVGDPRLEASLDTGFINLTTGLFTNYPYTKKFFDPNIINAGQNFEIIRYADILLMYSEVTGDPAYLNMVRQRVGLPLFGSIEYPSSLYPTLEKAIEHERRVELCFEFHRFFDLVRTGRAIEVMLAKGYYRINEDRLLFPIPQSAIDINPALKQNDGY